MRGVSRYRHPGSAMNVRMSALGVLAIISAAQAAAAPGVEAQAPAIVGSTVGVTERTGDPRTGDAPVAPRNRLALGAIVLGVAAVVPFDEALARVIRRPPLQGKEDLRDASGMVGTMGDPGAIILTSGLFAVGRLSGRPRMADIGLHATEAVLVSGAATGVLKVLVGRPRPLLPSADGPGESGEEAWELRPGRGVGGYASFPSGHTTVAFAAASAITSELRLTNARVSRIVGPVLFGGATALGLSRMYDNEHWASDVAMAAVVGTLAGRRVVEHQHAHPGNRVDRLLLGMTARSTDAGMSVGWSMQVR